MPFTPLHLGPALTVGVLLRRRLHTPTLLVASVITDVEPLLAFLFNPNYPLHGLLHTFLLAAPLGLATGYLMLWLESPLSRIHRALLLEPESGVDRSGFFAAGILGTFTHVLLDAPLYTDITPLYPLTANPFFNPSVSWDIYGICVVLGAVGIALYLAILGRHHIGGSARTRRVFHPAAGPGEN